MNEVDLELVKSEEDARRQHQRQSDEHRLEREAAALHESKNGAAQKESLEDSTGPTISHMPTVQDIEAGDDAERTRTLMSRTRTAQSVHANTIGADPTRTRSRKEKLPPFGSGKDYPPALPDQEQYVVEFDGFSDPLHPQNWSPRKKYLLSALLAATSAFCVWGSSIFSSAIFAVAQEFHVSAEVGTLGVSLYILGFATGPLIWAPLSELYGRRLPIIIAQFGFAIFQIAVAAGKDLQTVIICRFFGGLFAACPLAVVGGAFADIWDNAHRGYAINIFALTVSAPALLAPVVGGFIVNSSLGWRWTEWITGIIGFVLLFLNMFYLEETYAPVVLVEKARTLRRLTKNWGIHAKQEQIEVDLKELIEKNLSRPLKLLFTEPIVFFISLYIAFIYGMLYLMLTAYPIVFQRYHGISGGKGSLPLIGLILGQLLGGLIVFLYEPVYIRKMKANRGIPIPENRLPPAMLGSILFPIGLFWFAWTGNYPHIHWIVPTLSGIFIGAGIFLIFLQCLNYIIDAYLMFAASAIAANAFLRSIFGAVFPLFATYMFNALKVNWAGTLLALVSVVLLPCPFIFYKIGAKLRKRSKYAPTFGDN
ncbi:Major facilitator superfamily multidrug transporter [Drechslerella dactyloides]|uniref:Major facilitator superfamily multidrug transporter n=1 Tax=Drechslerella dactyloides TaxID=74499 RepID=A0AAD6IXK2_DREDA|nr:Major facilitator superfamily multidrug transporter [Drechslerella dactyloides]